MKSELVDFPNEYFKKKAACLTPLMIDTLLEACAKQKEKVPYGPCDIKRSFIALVNRGLIIIENVFPNEGPKLSWQVTPEAILILQSMGIENNLLALAKVPKTSKTRSILINLYI